MNKEVRQLVKQLRKQGFDIDQSGRHIKASRTGYQGSVTISRTPSDNRALKNSEAILRRKFDFKRKGG